MHNCCRLLVGVIMFYIAILLTGVESIFIVVSNLFTAAVSKHCKSPLMGSLVQHVGGALFGIVVITLFVGWPQISFKSVPAHFFTGGLFGALTVAASNYSIHKLGMASTAVLFVAGQILAALALNHFGILGALISLISFKKIVGAALLIVGAYLIVYKNKEAKA